MRNVLVQFVEKNPVLSYLSKCWERAGLLAAYPEYLLELPTWMARIPTVQPSVIKLIGQGICQDYQFLLQDEDTVWGSVLDATLEKWKSYVRGHPSYSFRLGGYVDPAHFRVYPNVTWVDSLPERTDWEVFDGWRCTPRLALSTGCPYPCSFCTISRKLTERSPKAIYEDAAAFEPLVFRHIYIDDKSFGIASNSRLLPEITRIVRRYNPSFEGFIVQSTVNLTRKHWREWEDLGVKFFEVGVETQDEPTLMRWKKPHTSQDACDLLDEWPENSHNLIPNIVIGGEGQGYTYTKNWLEYGHKRGQIPFANFYTLTAYPTQQHIVNLGYTGVVPSDADENDTRRSWLTSAESEEIAAWRGRLMEMFLKGDSNEQPTL